MKDRIKDIVSDVYGLDFTKKTRQREYVEARQAFCYFCRLLTDLGLSDIGEVVGYDHSTVTYAAKHYGEILNYPDVKTRCLKIEFVLGVNSESIDRFTGTKWNDEYVRKAFEILLGK